MEKIPAFQKLGFGLMRLPVLADGTVNMELFCGMVDRFLEEGFTYFDTAYVYHNGESEKAVRKALVERYARERFLLATKLPHNFLQQPEDVAATFQEQLERTGAQYFDFYLIHGVNNKNWERYERFECWEFVQEKKRIGAVRHMGFSFHGTPQLLEQLLQRHPQIDFVQLQLNYADWEDQRIAARKCYEIARRHGLPISVMEPVKGGMLASLPPEAAEILTRTCPHASQSSWALRFAAGLDGVMVVLSGMNTMEQLEDNMATLRAPRLLTEKESDALALATRELLSVPTVSCTGCRYCVKGCPAGLEIPTLLGVLNNCRLFESGKDTHAYWAANTDQGKKPARCLKCRQCEDACPQHLPIVTLLKELQNKF